MHRQPPPILLRDVAAGSCLFGLLIAFALIFVWILVFGGEL